MSTNQYVTLYVDSAVVIVESINYEHGLQQQVGTSWGSLRIGVTKTN